MKKYVLATRPKTLFASISPVLLGLSYCFFKGNSIQVLPALVCILCALGLQVFANLVNDYYDGVRGTDNSQRIGPLRFTAEGLISKTEMKRFFLLVLFFCGFLEAYLFYKGGWLIACTGILCTFVAWNYTGGKKPLSYLPLGELLAFIFFGPVAVWGTVYLQQSKEEQMALLLGMIPGFFAAALMGVNNLRDCQTDGKVGKRTLAVVLGEKYFKKIILFFLLMPSLISLYFSSHYSEDYFFFPIFLLIFCSRYFVKNLRQDVGSHLNVFLMNVGRFLFFYCLFQSASFVLAKI